MGSVLWFIFSSIRHTWTGDWCSKGIVVLEFQWYLLTRVVQVTSRIFALANMVREPAAFERCPTTRTDNLHFRSFSMSMCRLTGVWYTVSVPSELLYIGGSIRCFNPLHYPFP